MQNEVPEDIDNRTNFSFEIPRAQQLILLHKAEKESPPVGQTIKLQVPKNRSNTFSFLPKQAPPHCPHSLPQWPPVRALGYLPTHLKIMQI